ncbi:MAG: methylmalonyl-CoA mutase family protein [Bacteroidota bacterium]
MGKLFSEFRPISFKEWKNKANFDLDGKDFNQVLTYHSLEGISAPPYLSADSKSKKNNHSRISSSDLRFSKSFLLKNDERSIKILRSTLREEFDTIIIYIPEGFSLESLNSVHNLFNRDISLRFESFEEGYLPIIEEWAKKISAGNKIYLNIDPISRLASRGNWQSSEKEDLELLKKAASIKYDNIIPFSIDSSLFQNSGANIIQQVAYTLAISVEYANIIGADFFSGVQYNFAFGSNFFFEIAKISAFDYLIDLIKSKYNIVTENIILGESSLRNKSIYDSHNNLLRSTTEAFSAIISGVDTYANEAFDSTYNAPNKFSGRLAYNQLMILKEEAKINKVDNISEGSYYIDYLKGEISEKALDIFKQIENGGGFLKQLKEGVIQRKVRESALKEQELFNKGELSIVGANSFENKREQMDPKIRKYPFQKIKHQKNIISKITPKRLSEEIEKQRLSEEKRMGLT